MAILDFLTGRQQQPMGGLVGQLQQPQPQAQRGIMGDQGFLQSLARLGAALGPNLAAASTQNENFLDALSLATAQTAKEQQANEASMLDRQVKEAQIRKLNAEAQPGSPFGGTGFENQVAGTYYQAYLAQGMSPMEAQVKAAQAVFNREPTYIQNAEGQIIPIPGRTLPNVLGGDAPVAPATMPAAMQTPAAQDPIDQTAAALGLPTGALLPPPSGTQPTGAMPTQGVLPPPGADVLAIGIPQVGGPRTQQALTQAAGEAQIGLQTEEAKKQQEKRTAIGEDINAGYNALQSMNQMLSASSEAFTSQGLPQGFKVAAARVLAPNDPALQRQLAATAQLGASRVQAFGPMLKELVGPGAVTEAERANAMEAISKPGMSDVEVRAIIQPLMEKSRNRLQVLEQERAFLSQGQQVSRKAIADQLGIDFETGLQKGQTAADFLPQGPVRRFNPATGRLE